MTSSPRSASRTPRTPGSAPAAAFTARVRTPVLALTAALAFAVAVGPAFERAALADPGAGADADAEVQRRFKLGNTLYGEGRYADALVEYDAAYELSKNWKILYNRAQCLVMLRREPEAIATFEQYLKDGGAQVPIERRKSVESDLHELRARLGTILVEGAPPASEVRLDGRLAGITPLAVPIQAGAGVHEITVIPQGSSAPFVRSVKVLSGQVTAVRVEIASSAPPAPPQGPAPAPRAPPDASPTADTSPAKEPELPPRAPGGLVSPALTFSLQLGASMPAEEHRAFERRALGAGELGVGYRLGGFWEIGAFAAGARGDRAVRGDLSGDTTLRAPLEANATYQYGTLGLRGRMHLLRTRTVDGWVGVDVGTWQELWTFGGDGGFRYRANSALFGLAVGADVPIARTWAIGGSLRFLSASASNGRREECRAGVPCDGLAGLPGEGLPGGRSSTSRGFFELALRVVWSLPTGADSRPAKPSAPSTPSTSPATGSSLARASLP